MDFWFLFTGHSQCMSTRRLQSFWSTRDHNLGEYWQETLAVPICVMACYFLENKGLWVNEGDFSSFSKTQTDWLTILHQLSIETIPKHGILVLWETFSFSLNFPIMIHSNSNFDSLLLLDKYRHKSGSFDHNLFLSPWKRQEMWV